MTKKGNLSKLRFLPAIIYAAMIFYFSSMSTIPNPEAVLGLTIDSTIKHFLEYFVFGLLLIYAFEGSKNKTIAVIITGALYAATDEIHQYFVPGRVMDIIDFSVDTIGIITSIITVNIIARWQSKKK
jgi:hypothetical protein